jgi:hypothetical protein
MIAHKKGKKVLISMFLNKLKTFSLPFVNQGKTNHT